MYLKYVGIRVTDLDRSVAFYTEVLGLKELRRRDMTKYGIGIWVLLEDGTSHQRLELNWYLPGSAHATPFVVGEGLDHIGFVVDDVAAAYKELLAKGATPAGVGPEDTGGWTAFVKDPDGIWIEVFQLTEPKPSA